MLRLHEMPKREALEKLARRFHEVDPSAAEACLTILHVACDLRSFAEEYFGRYEMSNGRFMLLMVLYRFADEKLTPADLAERVCSTRATVTGLLDGLERAGLVERLKHPHDRRKIIVGLTAKGEQTLEGMLPGHFGRIAGLMSGLSETERKTLVRLLIKVETAIREFEQE